MNPILFLDDWKKHPSAVVHLETKNESFKRVAMIYKTMNIKNHAFLLSLHNPALKNIDPFDPDLDTDTKQMIAIEASENPWYFIRECVRIPGSGSLGGIPFMAHRGNIAYLWTFFNHVPVFLILPRQKGKSVVCDVKDIILINLAGVNIRTLLYTKDDKLRKANIDRIKTIFEYLPPYLNMRTKGDSDNEENITVNALGNKLLTCVGQSTIAGAYNVGRGLTAAVLNVDELPHIPNVHISLPKLMPITDRAQEIAKMQGAPYGISYTTTPGYRHTKPGRFGYDIYVKSTRWTEKYLDMKDEKELHETVKKNSPVGVLRMLVEFNHRQLGETDEWLQEKILNSNSSKMEIEAEYLNIWPVGNEESPLSKEELESVKNSREGPKYQEISKQGFVLHWYKTEEEVDHIRNHEHIIIGIDASEMIGNDDTTVYIRDIKTGEVLASGVFNSTNTVEFSKFLSDLLINYPNSTLIPENKSTMVGILDNLLLILPELDIDPFKRIYNKVVDNMDTNEEYREIVNTPLVRRTPADYVKYRKEFGFKTAGTGANSRGLLYGSVFRQSVKYTSHLVRDKTLIHQLISLVIKNNRIDHGDSDHDDAVIAWLLGYWFLSYAKNKHIYGINADNVLIGVKLTMNKEAGGPEAEYKKYINSKLMNELDIVIEKIKNSQDEFTKEHNINRARLILNQLEINRDEAIRIEEVLKQISLERLRYNYNDH